ncbi:MAG TPA: hypothetical protein VFE02_05810 [Candidatus Acidoferrales bacterium]|jgi:mono/diheme cytochrome c family protein|nr:hypothetical protein [Candidatus Acidoferrales bacterium]
MKTYKYLEVALVIGAIGTGTAVYAQHKTGQYEAGSSGKITQPLAQPLSTDSSYDEGPLLTYRPTLAPGDGRQEVEVYCNTCHSSIYITMQPPLPADTWAAEVTKMRKTFGADFPDEIANKVVRYLQANYTPDTRKH